MVLPRRESRKKKLAATHTKFFCSHKVPEKPLLPLGYGCSLINLKEKKPNHIARPEGGRAIFFSVFGPCLGRVLGKGFRKPLFV